MKGSALELVSILHEAPGGTGTQLLSIALTRSWNRFACSLTSQSEGVRFLKPRVTAVPAGLSGCASSEEICDIDNPAVFQGAHAQDSNGPLLIMNGRYALELDRQMLMSAAREFAGVTSLELSGAPSYYDEILKVGRDAEVLGYRRSYHPRLYPSSPPDSWPSLIIIAKEVRHLFSRQGVPKDYGEFVAFCETHYVPVRCLIGSGRALDLAMPGDLLEYFTRISPMLARHRRRGRGDNGSREPSLHGSVIAEKGSQLQKGVVGIGPLYLGEGCEVGAECVLSGCMIGPGAVVPPKTVVRGQVWLRSGRTDGRGEVSTLPLVRLECRSGYRRWPLFSYARFGKRIFDFLFALTAMALLVIAFPAIAVAIKCTSSGPVFYRHKRQGLHGKPFDCLKFRTMVTDASRMQQDLKEINEVDGPQFKIEDDPRVTIVGQFLRTTNLDELPQFLNVLAGQMSIVGPRPSPDDENQMCPSWREARLSVRPGITGLWQVRRSPAREHDFQEWIRYDRDYVRGVSFLLDVKIILMTVVEMAGRFFRLFQGAKARP